MDEPCGGTLRFSGHWILTNVFVTQADILTTVTSTHTSVRASPITVRGLTAELWSHGIRSLAGVGKLVGPLTHPVLYLHD